MSERNSLVLNLERRLLLTGTVKFAVIVAFVCLVLSSTPAWASEETTDQATSPPDTAVDATATTTVEQNAESGDAVITEEVPPTPEEALPAEPLPEEVVGDGTSTGAPATEVITPETETHPGCVIDPVTGEVVPVEQPSDGSVISTDANINNDLCSTAGTGNATVDGDYSSGNAGSGEAIVTATIINQIQSITGLSDQGVITFIQDIYGDVFGDIVIDPFLLNYLLDQTCNDGCLLPGDVDFINNLAINNEIYLSAESGDAQILGDGTSGNATTGNATVILNLINIINSVLATGQPFIGTINIYGNLEGDILLPPDVLNSLLSGGGEGSGGFTPGTLTQTIQASINNYIAMNAASGGATIAGEGTSGDATTGSASNTLSIYNLINSLNINSNALLVFVNVLGYWNGYIVNSPIGVNAAMLGGVTPIDCQGCQIPIYADYSADLSINNNISVSATTGNAQILGNGTSGSATTGDASTLVNIINIINSNLSFADWFGILFINVFGTWEGSFGIDTAAGDSSDSVTPHQNNNSTQTLKKTLGSFGAIAFYSGYEPEVTSEPSDKKAVNEDTNEVLGVQDTANPQDDNNQWLMMLLTLGVLAALGTRQVNARIKANNN